MYLCNNVYVAAPALSTTFTSGDVTALHNCESNPPPPPSHPFWSHVENHPLTWRPTSMYRDCALAQQNMDD